MIDGDQLPRERLRRQQLEDDIEDLIGKPQQDRGLATWSLHHTVRGTAAKRPVSLVGAANHTDDSTTGESGNGDGGTRAVVSGPPRNTLGAAKSI